MTQQNNEWALILGASSGFGEATARELASRGFNIAGVHLDRKEDLTRVDKIISDLQAEGVQVKYFNENAAREKTRKKVLSDIREDPEEKPQIQVFLHSLAFGTLKPYVADEGEEPIQQKQMTMTMDVMSHSLVFWVQDLLEAGLFEEGSRIFAMTSAGGHLAWPYYGAVSAAKASIEAHIRQLAVELGDKGITANAIQAGVTDTPSLRKIPDHESMLNHAKQINPANRLTRPEDVANAIALLTQEESQFITGNVIRCDGGEDISG